MLAWARRSGAALRRLAGKSGAALRRLAGGSGAASRRLWASRGVAGVWLRSAATWSARRLAAVLAAVRTAIGSLAGSRPGRALLRGPLGRAVAGATAPVRRIWRRSLQFRVVSITLVLSAVLVGAFGWLMASTITQGLLEAKVSTARKQVVKGGEYAADQLKGVTQSNDPALLTTIPAVVAQLANSPEEGGREVVMLSVDDSLRLNQQASDPAAYSLLRAPELAGLRRLVGNDGQVAYQLVTADPDRGGKRPWLVLGTRVDSYGQPLELYYLFPLDDEVTAADLVRTTVIVTGAALVALLALVAALVTGLVVRPVRLAARTAQRLSAGMLEQRMLVRGEDDLAQLATSFNQMAASLQRHIERLEEMSRLQRRFTSDVSHELRTPLTTVRMAADLIFGGRAAFDPAVARSAELLQTELDRFEDLLTDLLEISRFDAGFAMLDAEPTDLVPTVRRVVEALTPLAVRAGSVLDLWVPVMPMIAEVDGRRVERILRNLVGNAVEHGEGRPVQVTLASNPTSVAITVRDHGVGLRPGEEKLVFNRFWRADPSRARQTGGTGLGLSISLEDARLHGGWLESWGEPGQGAVFRLTLPVRTGDQVVASPLPLVPDAVVPDAVVPDDGGPGRSNAPGDGGRR